MKGEILLQLFNYKPKNRGNMFKQIKTQQQFQVGGIGDGRKGDGDKKSESPKAQVPMRESNQSGSSKESIPESLKGEAAILKEAFEQFMKGQISKKGLERIDDVLSNADIVVNKAGDGATIVDSDGKSTQLGSNRPSRNR
jgi:5'-3' exonuclease